MSWGVLIADDNPLIRNGVRRLFEGESGFEVIGEAKHGAEAIEKAIALRPNLIILDFSMPVMNGLEAASMLRKNVPSVFIIMLTLFVGDKMEASAREAGVHAFVPKNHAATRLVPTARALFDKRPIPKGKSTSA
jgi:DNA-binding NarL/FixJ family response regulator